jgi:large subunit ribosomal protein L29
MARKKQDISYKELNEEELLRRAEKTHEDLFKLRFRAPLAPVKNTMQIRALKREYARLQTFINQRRKSP